MRTRKLTALLAVGAAALLGLTACASGTPGDSTGGTGGGGGTEGGGTGGGDALVFEPASDVQLEGSSTFDRMQKAGTITIGVKEDQPGLGYLDALTGERSGFDVDMARWIAASLGFGEDQITFQQIPSANREQALVNGDIDIYVGTYSITDSRKEQIGFAGPYYITGQGLLVPADSEIKSDADLTAGTVVCSVTGSTPIQNIRENYPEVAGDIVEFDTYSQCVEQMLNGQVDVVTTDEAILLGYAAQDPDNLQVVGEPFTEELYGIGLSKGDDALRGFINDTLEGDPDMWQAVYDHNFGATGVEGVQPAVDRY